MLLNQKVKIIAVEPEWSVIVDKSNYYSDVSCLDYISKNYDSSIPQYTYKVSDSECFRIMRLIAKSESILVGPSSVRGLH